MKICEPLLKHFTPLVIPDYKDDLWLDLHISWYLSVIVTDENMSLMFANQLIKLCKKLDLISKHDDLVTIAFSFYSFYFFFILLKMTISEETAFQDTTMTVFCKKKCSPKLKKEKPIHSNLDKIFEKYICRKIFFEGISIFLPILKCKWYDLLYKLRNLIRRLTLKLTVSLMHLKSHSTIISWTFFHLSALNPLSILARKNYPKYVNDEITHKIYFQS